MPNFSPTRRWYALVSRSPSPPGFASGRTTTAACSRSSSVFSEGSEARRRCRFPSRRDVRLGQQNDRAPLAALHLGPAVAQRHGAVEHGPLVVPITDVL